MKLSVVIPHYYRERRANLDEIIASICLGSMWPDEVVIWNNESDPVKVTEPKGLPVLVVQSPRNVGAQARVIAALVARGERVLFLDNDVAVNRRTIERLYEWSVLQEDRNRAMSSVVTLEGRERPVGWVGRSYSLWPKVYGHGIKIARAVWLTLGRGEMVKKDVLRTALAHFPLAETTAMDDLYLSYAYEKIGAQVLVVPCVAGESDLRELPMRGVGMCKETGYTERRNEAIQRLREEGMP